MYRVGVVTKMGRIEAQNYTTRDEVDNYLLELDEKEGLRHFRIYLDGKVIETEMGKRV